MSPKAYLVWQISETADDGVWVLETDADSAACDWGLKHFRAKKNASLQYTVDVMGPWGRISRHNVDLMLNSYSKRVERPRKQ